MAPEKSVTKRHPDLTEVGLENIDAVAVAQWCAGATTEVVY